jgi:hypothetical protein
MDSLFIWKTKGDLSYFFIIGTLFIDTSLFLDKKIGFRKMISQDSQFVSNYNVPIFKEKLWQNVF